jgi:hypothetical protein
MEYVGELPWQTVLLPLMALGCAGRGLTVTAKICAELLPQLLFALTEMFPLLAPTVVVIDVVVEDPVHPDGSVHV